MAQGERFDSVNYARIKVATENSEKGMKLKLKFIITREIKVKQHFIIIGSMYLDNNMLILAGNSRLEDNNAKITHSPAYLLLNTHQVEIEEPQNIKVHRPFGSDALEREMLLRSFIGVVSGNMLFTVKMKESKWGIAKMTGSTS